MWGGSLWEPILASCVFWWTGPCTWKSPRPIGCVKDSRLEFLIRKALAFLRVISCSSTSLYLQHRNKTCVGGIRHQPGFLLEAFIVRKNLPSNEVPSTFPSCGRIGLLEPFHPLILYGPSYWADHWKDHFKAHEL